MKNRRVLRKRAGCRGPTRRWRRWLEPLEARQLLAVHPIVSEFMAGNYESLRDGDGGSSDWIELFNPGTTDLDLGGYHLTDDPEDLMRWGFPRVTLPAGGYMVVFASGQEAGDYVDAGGSLHTNFQLDRSGEFLALVAPGGEIVSQYDSAAGTFPAQFTDVSYGVAQPLSVDGAATPIGYQPVPSPHAQNLTADEIFIGYVEEVRFSVERGFYDSPQHVTITTTTPGATIVYTLDGSTPSATNGERVPAASSQVGPVAHVTIETTTTLRALAIKDHFLPTTVDTHTYIFVHDVVNQNNTPAGYPTGWKSNVQTLPADYEMDPEITQNPAYREIVDDALLAIPTISLVADVDSLFDTETGIYMNPEQRGEAWERPVSVELIYPDGAKGFQEDAGLRIQGGASRMPGLSPKHSFRVLFKPKYGVGRLEFPLFGPTAADDFDTFILRAGFNQSWIHNNEFQGDNRGRAQYIRDQWAKETQLAMGHVAPHSNYAHLYVNGIYWGLYNPTERPSAPFAASYFGGSEDDYDVINSGTLVDGDLTAWNRMFALAERGVQGGAEYQALSEMLDIDAFIDYMLLNQYGGNLDWDSHNWYVFRRREPAGKFYWIAWDSEFIFIDKHDNVLAVDQVSSGRGPGHLFQKLIENASFRDRLADRITQHFTGDGALTVDQVVRRWNALSEIVYPVVVAESARWGDYRRDVDRGLAPLDLYERDVHWIAERNRLLNEYFPNRGQIVIDQFIEAGLYTDIPVPLFSQDGGTAAAGAEISLSVSSGTIYYTTDGSDPRAGEAVVESQPLADAGAAARAYVPVDGTLSTDWTLSAFDDSAWKSGSTGVGYERRSGYESLIALDVNAEMYGKNTSVYVRVPFDVDDPARFDQLILNIKYDDGFEAYLNGVEIGRRNTPDDVAWDSTAAAARNDQFAREYEAVNVSAYLHLLRPGRNVLAIHGMNSRVRDDDFLIAPQLLGGRVTDAGQSATARTYGEPIRLTEDTVIKARTLLGAQWSSLNVADFTVQPLSGTLRISEIMYHPSDPSQEEMAAGFDDADDFEYLEFVNIGSNTLDLRDFELTQGVTFAFRDSDIRRLAPGQRVVVVEDAAAFRFRYGDTPRIAGQWTGQLSNGGETIVVAFAGNAWHQFDYDDAWYATTDGGGPSLELIDPLGTPLEEWSMKSSWRPSQQTGGTPAEPTLLPGDVNFDGVFDSEDLLSVLQAGEYEDDLAGNSDWAEGDWNGDGDFSSEDMVLVFQLVKFLQS